MSVKTAPIEFEKVINYIEENTKLLRVGTTTIHPRLIELVKGCEDFSNYYCKFPLGFSETDNLNDKKECLGFIYSTNMNLHLSEEDQNALNQICKRELKEQKERFKSKNSTGLGRHIGRLHYLLSLES
jgi:hypothetical protein